MIGFYLIKVGQDIYYTIHNIQSRRGNSKTRLLNKY